MDHDRARRSHPLRRISGALALALLAALGCADDPLDPERQIAAWLASCEAAAESGDARTIQQRIAEDYADASRRDAQALRSLIGFEMLRRQSVHLWLRIAQLDLVAPGQAEVLLFLGMGASTLEELELLPALETSLYRIELGLRAPPAEIAAGRWESWRVTRADFRPASLSEVR